MIISKRTAQRWMKAGKAVVRRHSDCGEQMADATTWRQAMEQARKIGASNIVLDNISTHVTAHVSI